MIEIYDDLVPLETQRLIEKELTGPYFPWFLSSGTNHGTTDYSVLDQNIKPDSLTREYLQFTHTLLHEGNPTWEMSELIISMFESFCDKADINFKSLFRVKANFQTQCNFSKEEFYNTPHNDAVGTHKVAIYYVNDSDGDTVLFDLDGNIIKTVNPKKGRFLVFDGNYYHAGRHPILADMRIVINFNFKE